jgi:hypothetical protein
MSLEAMVQLYDKRVIQNGIDLFLVLYYVFLLVLGYKLF